MPPRWVLAGRRVRSAAAAGVAPWSPAVRWGAGVFETIGCDGGHPLLLEPHLERLRAGLVILGWTLPALPGEPALQRLLAREGVTGPGALRVQALAGGAGVRVVTWAGRYRPPRRLRENGAALLPMAHPAGPLTGVKSCSYLPHWWASRQARLAGADAALLVDGDGAVREADHANIFAATADGIATPPAPRRCLPGVMRSWCIDTLRAAGIPVHERDLTPAELLASHGAWLTSSLAGIVPVRRIGDCEVPAPRELLALLRRAGVPAPG